MTAQDETGTARCTGGEVSLLVRRWREGDHAARDRLAVRMLPELRILAERALQRLDQPVSLHPSDLVHESVIQLMRDGADGGDSSHLRALAAQIVRTTLIDYLRVRGANKRGRRETHNVSLAVMNGLPGDDLPQVDLLAIHEAMEALERTSSRAARIVEMRIFGGMSELEICVVLGVSRPTVARDWAAAKLWLLRFLSEDPHDGAAE